MERRDGRTVAALSALDRLYLRRACELAARGSGNVSPNPAVGAVIVAGTRTLGEGFHHLRGEAHAEVEALHDVAARGNDARGATAYVSLEPCNHHGRTPPCTQALIGAGIARVVIAAIDPNPRTAAGGVARLREADIVVDVAADAAAREAIEPFTRFITSPRPYVRLKMAASLDGYVAPRTGERHWLTGPQASAYVRDLRATYDLVLVGAGTVRVDDPELSVRPPRSRRTAFRRAIACETAPVPADRAIFRPLDGYAKTIVLAPAGLRDAFVPLEPVADVAYVGAADERKLDLHAALAHLHARDVTSVLCEGGPALASRLLARGLVDRFDWLVAPAFLRGAGALPVLSGELGERTLRFDRVETLGPDLLVSGVPVEG